VQCNLERYKPLVEWTVGRFNDTEALLIEVLGREVFAYLVMAIVVIPVVFLFGWAQYILIPKFARWYYDQTIVEKARDWFTKQGLAFLGFRHSTAIISIATGATFYILMRAAVAFPSQIIYTVPALLVVFMSISVLGYFVSGNVPPNDEARHKYFKRFYSPTVTGLGLAIGTILLDALISMTTIVVNMMLT
jgi:ABC-type multidrug transport system permease subunit